MGSLQPSPSDPLRSQLLAGRWQQHTPTRCADAPCVGADIRAVCVGPGWRALAPPALSPPPRPWTQTLNPFPYPDFCRKKHVHFSGLPFTIFFFFSDFPQTATGDFTWRGQVLEMAHHPIPLGPLAPGRELRRVLESRPCYPRDLLSPAS